MLDKAVAITSAVAAGPLTLGELAARTQLPRPTAHRIAVALEHHGLLSRDDQGRFIMGSTPAAWAGFADHLVLASQPVVLHLRDATRESAQVYRRAGNRRMCIAAAEPEAGLRDTVPIGAMLSLQAGSAAQVLLAWLPPEARKSAIAGSAFTAADLEQVRKRGWAHSLGQREPGVASISAPVHDHQGTVIAAVSVSGPIERIEVPTEEQLAALAHAAHELGNAAGL